jgi:hypothetical protein
MEAFMVYILMFSIEIQIMNISALGLPKVLVLGIVSTTSMRRIQTLAHVLGNRKYYVYDKDPDIGIIRPQEGIVRPNELCIRCLIGLF